MTPEVAACDLSVIIAAKNAASTISDQLEALTSQAWSGSWEILVADNGSTDDTRQIIEQYHARHPHVRLVDASDGTGAGHARNVAMREANGRAFAFCDADDVVEPGWVPTMGSDLLHHPFVSGPINVDKLNPPWLQTAFYSTPPRELEYFAGIFPFGSTCNLGVQRDVAEVVGGFDASFLTGQDLEFCLRLWQAGVPLHYEPNAVVQYRYRPSMRALWRRSYQYGEVGPVICRRLRDAGVRAPSHLAGLRQYLWLVRRLPALRTKAGRARWVVVAGQKAGRLRGSVRARWQFL